MCSARTNASWYLVWLLAFAYSLAPFEIMWSAGGLDVSFGLGFPRDGPELGALALHLLAFAAVGVVDRAATAGNEQPPLPPAALARGLLFCAAIELLQAVVRSRHAEVLDLVLNSVGFFAGHHCFQSSICRNSWLLLQDLLRRRGPVALLAVMWVLVWCSILLVPKWLLDLDDWDPTYHLTVGGEREQERAWSGELAYVAIYGRALQFPDLAETVAHPPSGPLTTTSRMAIGLLVAYEFTRPGRFDIEPQGPIDDRNNRILLPESIRWTGASTPAVSLPATSPVSTLGSVDRLINRLSASRSFSIEVWCRARTLSPAGSSSIVAISDTVWRRNVALGQNRTGVYFSVRNALNGRNGSRFELQVPNAMTSGLDQIVATYSDGASAVFINGRPARRFADLREPSVLLHLGDNTVAHIVTALLCALSLMVLGAGNLGSGSMWLGLVRLGVFGAICLLSTIVIGSLLSFRPAESLLALFCPAFFLCSIATHRTELNCRLRKRQEISQNDTARPGSTA